MGTYEEIKTSIQGVSFLSSVFFNSLLIYLILTKSPKKMGNYRFLMIYFSCFAIFFSAIDFVVGPYVHSHGKSFSVLTINAQNFLSRSTQFVLMCILCGCFGVTITFFSIHFVFRYFALERRGRLSYFHGQYFFLWLTIPVFCGVIWGVAVSYFLAPTAVHSEYIRESVLTNYNLTMENVVYIGAQYWRIDENGDEEIVEKSVGGFLFFVSIITISFCIVCYYGILSYRRINSLMDEGVSLYTKNLQRQLYKALVFQASIPTFLMYVPVGSYMILPAFGVNIESFSKLVTFLYAAYPAVDPLPLFFVIDNYRLALAEWFFCCEENKNRVAGMKEEISRGQTTA